MFKKLTKYFKIRKLKKDAIYYPNMKSILELYNKYSVKPFSIIKFPNFQQAIIEHDNERDDYVEESISLINKLGKQVAIMNGDKTFIIKAITEITPPCKHPGCYNHITHPCEGCGRIQGKLTIDGLKELLKDIKWIQ